MYSSDIEKINGIGKEILLWLKKRSKRFDSGWTHIAYANKLVYKNGIKTKMQYDCNLEQYVNKQVDS